MESTSWRHPLNIGGPGHVVEIDKSAFVQQKHNVGHPMRTQWVFGGLDTYSGWISSCCRQERCRYSIASLAGVCTASTVVSDLWGTYRTVNNLGYQHLTVNQRLHFIDPVTHATTNCVELMWYRAKLRNKKECSTHYTLGFIFS